VDRGKLIGLPVFLASKGAWVVEAADFFGFPDSRERVMRESEAAGRRMEEKTKENQRAHQSTNPHQAKKTASDRTSNLLIPL